ncbi:flagellar assembly protein FliH [Ferrimonas pelagia]|uniref:Flagellar assembly protein FliH n=1 Tax=Ferrimonas pelagia TaxID=1177826 RepID=A0ABP9ED57_9GAMM
MAQHRKTAAYADVIKTRVADWPLPDFGEPESVEPALHRLAAEPESEPEAVEPELPAPPTLEEIEDIQRQAWQEGFDAGKVEGTQQGVQEGRLKGAEQGLQEGLEQGRQQGLEAGHEEILHRLGRLDGLLNEMIAPLEAVDEAVERELVTLAMRLAQAVVQVELKTSPEAVLEALRLGVQALPNQHQQVQIGLNQDDLTLVEQSYGAEQLAERQWQLQLEPSLEPGSLRIQTQRSEVPMLADDRLRKVLEHFAATPRAPVAEPAYPIAALRPTAEAAPEPEPNTTEPVPEQPTEASSEPDAVAPRTAEAVPA